MKAKIPSLGMTGAEVLRKALEYDCAGFLLKFFVVGEGEWQYNKSINKFEKTKLIGKIPVIERTEGPAFDSWLTEQIYLGFVSIYVELTCGAGKELHRATGRKLELTSDERN
jgi:hypothetical protein